jgi:Ca-activated chloride channel family protein
MTFANPWCLLLLVLIPVIGWFMARPGKSGSALAAYPDLRLLGSRVGGLRPFLARHLPWMRLAVLFFLIIGMARPQVSAGVKDIGGSGIDIMLCMDISGSMQAEDFKPKNRFTVAREVLREFISQAGANRLGLVVFAGQAFTQSPLASDHAIVSQLLERVNIGMLEDGTAIGMGLATAANRLQASKARSKVIILLTDGVNNRGEIDPPTAAQAAAALGIKIYAIGVGKEGGAPVPVPDPLFGKRYLRDAGGNLVMTKLDEETLKKIAKITGGQYFRATDAETLRAIYQQIDKMEKSEFTAKRERKYNELLAKYLWPGVILLLVQFVLGATWLRKAP